MRALRASSLLLLLLVGSSLAAGDEPTYTLRMATLAPQGTAWAREMASFARDVALVTNGQVAVKWYLGGIAGDDTEAAKRIGRDQLDGVGAGPWQCERWAPSITVTRLPGLFRSRDESKYVMARLRPTFDEEFKKSGFVFLGDAQLGPGMLFSRRPVRTMDELKHIKMWTLEADPVRTRLMSALGLSLVTLSFDQARPAYEQGRLDGFLAPPSAVLAFQWSTQAHYLVDLPTDYIMACLVVSTRAFDRLPFEHQRAVRAAAAKFMVRFDDVGLHSDAELVGRLFERQGLKVIHHDERFRAEYEAAGRAAWEKLDEATIPHQLIKQVRAILTAYRVANPTR
ncbi:MAG: TRAP-type C4-dicarboxylate transport system, substrate-binding protein [bacterium]|nr:TRAP-type C4-dicarboxylate transport system, substrate-binding protein [bacterium]